MFAPNTVVSFQFQFFLTRRQSSRMGRSIARIACGRKWGINDLDYAEVFAILCNRKRELIRGYGSDRGTVANLAVEENMLRSSKRFPGEAGEPLPPLGQALSDIFPIVMAPVSN